MSEIPDQLNAAAEDVKKGLKAETTPRALLAWFGFYRRTSGNTWTMKAALKALGLRTEPDFTEVWVDSTVAIVAEALANSTAESKSGGSTESAATATVEAESQKEEFNDPTQRIGRLKAASRTPVSVKRDAPLSEAVTLMLLHDYSQLPVMQGDRSVEGLVSWKSIGTRLALGRKCLYVRECMDSAPPIVSTHESLLKAIYQIVEHDVVLIQSPDKKIVGIVTSSDVSIEFNKLGEPFFILNEIENHIRNLLLSAKFTITELESGKDPGDANRKIQSVVDLTFGEYIRILEIPKNWERLKLGLDRVKFIKDLSRMRNIRNDVMHFDPDPLDPHAVQDLKQFLQYIRRIQDLRKTL